MTFKTSASPATERHGGAQNALLTTVNQTDVILTRNSAKCHRPIFKFVSPLDSAVN